MGSVISKIPALAKQRNIDARYLAMRGIAPATAYRALRGEIDFSIKIITQLCDAFEASGISDLFEYIPENKKAPGTTQELLDQE